ncbi:MAG: ankyrin repeat domain-containing protein [Myxococcota bacterium]
MPRSHQPGERLTAGDWLLLHDTGGQLRLRRLRLEKRRVTEIEGLASELLAGGDSCARPSLDGGTSSSFGKLGKALDECRRRLERWQQEGWIVVEYSELQSGMAEHHMDNGLLRVSLADGDAAIVQRIRDRWTSENNRELCFARLDEMRDAIRRQDHARVRALLAEHGSGPLYCYLVQMSVISGDRTLVSMLLDAGCPIEDDRRNFAPLAIAAEANDAPMVALLLDRGADIDAYGAHRRRAIHDAAFVGAQDAIAVLLERGVSLDSVDRWGSSAIELAAEQGHEAVVDQLLPHVSGEHRQRAEAKRAEGRRRKERAATLDPRTGPLLWAAFRNRADIVQRLLDAGVSVNARAPDGRSALDVAVDQGHEELAQMLRSAGAEG